MLDISIQPCLNPIAQKYPGILLDAYGVFWGGNSAGLFPGSKAAMELLVSSGKIVGILSNSTQLAAKEIEKLKDPKHGLAQGVHYHFLLTSGETARQAFLKGELPYKRYWVFCNGHPKFNNAAALFQGTIYQEASHWQEADFVYIGVPHLDGADQINPSVFREQLHQLRAKNLPLVCANPDRFAHEGNPPQAVVRQGSIARLYEEIGGRVLYFGKPYTAVYDCAMHHFSQYNIIYPHNVLMVGDTPETDIQGATKVGMDSALVIETGTMGDRVAASGLQQCLLTLSKQEKPTHYIQRL